MSLNEIVKTMQDAVNRQTDQAKPGGYDTTATVRRIEGDTAFVHIPGGVDETPVKLTINAKAGDNVQVRVSGGNAFLVGNGSAPPTDDAAAIVARTIAVEAQGTANSALDDATRARDAADAAEVAAQDAKDTADSVHDIAVQASEDAADAKDAADDAQASATTANTAANGALSSLSTVQDVIGVLDWASKNAEYTLTSDTAITPGKTYWTRSGSGTEADPYIYTPVVNPVVADIGTYYEISSVDEAMANYVSSHTALTDEGLYVMADGSAWKVLVADDGVYIIDPSGDKAAKYKSDTTLGIDDGSQSFLKLDYHSMQMIDKESNVYFHVSDLREFDGRITDSFVADGTQTDFYMSASINTRVDPNYEHVSVTVDDVPSLAGLTVDHIHFTSAPSADSIVKVKYYPATNFALGDAFFKAYTLGIRKQNEKIGAFSVVEGYRNSAAGYLTHAEGGDNQTNGNYSHAEGKDNTVNGGYSHVEGWMNKVTAAGSYAHAEGRGTTSAGSATHAEGWYSKAEGHYSHAEGRSTTTTARAEASHAEGYSTTVSGEYAHAEGENTTASSEASHAEGKSTVASANSAHAEGGRSVASNSNAHAQNLDTRATKNSQTALGTYNIADASSTTTHPSGGTHFGQYAVIVGNGTADNARSNAATLDWSGNLETDGDITDGSGNVLSAKANTASLATVATSGSYTDLTNKPTIPTATSDLTNDSGFISEDANGDISITRNITAGGNVKAAGDVTDGAGNVLSSIAAHAVISTGSTGGWNYKKYADGTFEATRFSTSGATGTMTQLGSTGIYYSSAAEITFPSIGITSIRSCLASVMPSSNYLMSYYMSRLTTAHVYFSYIRYGSGAAVTDISYEIAITGTYS